MNITHLSGVVVTEAARSGDFFAGAPAPALTFFRPKTEAVQTVFTQKVKNFMLNFLQPLQTFHARDNFCSLQKQRIGESHF